MTSINVKSTKEEQDTQIYSVYTQYLKLTFWNWWDSNGYSISDKPKYTWAAGWLQCDYKTLQSYPSEPYSAGLSQGTSRKAWHRFPMGALRPAAQHRLDHGIRGIHGQPIVILGWIERRKPYRNYTETMPNHEHEDTMNFWNIKIHIKLILFFKFLFRVVQTQWID